MSVAVLNQSQIEQGTPQSEFSTKRRIWLWASGCSTNWLTGAYKHFREILVYCLLRYYWVLQHGSSGRVNPVPHSQPISVMRCHSLRRYLSILRFVQFKFSIVTPASLCMWHLGNQVRASSADVTISNPQPRYISSLAPEINITFAGRLDTSIDSVSSYIHNITAYCRRTGNLGSGYSDTASPWARRFWTSEHLYTNYIKLSTNTIPDTFQQSLLSGGIATVKLNRGTNCHLNTDCPHVPLEDRL